MVQHLGIAVVGVRVLLVFGQLVNQIVQLAALQLVCCRRKLEVVQIAQRHNMGIGVGGQYRLHKAIHHQGDLVTLGFAGKLGRLCAAERTVIPAFGVKMVSNDNDAFAAEQKLGGKGFAGAAEGGVLRIDPPGINRQAAGLPVISHCFRASALAVIDAGSKSYSGRVVQEGGADISTRRSPVLLVHRRNIGVQISRATRCCDGGGQSGSGLVRIHNAGIRFAVIILNLHQTNNVRGLQIFRDGSGNACNFGRIGFGAEILDIVGGNPQLIRIGNNLRHLPLHTSRCDGRKAARCRDDLEVAVVVADNPADIRLEPVAGAHFLAGVTVGDQQPLRIVVLVSL
ncbi:hypothetical protein D3C75_472130 [compost metagenome]